MSVPSTWQKSSFSGSGDGNNCVEVATVAGAVRVREGDAPRAAVESAPGTLAALLRCVKGGRLHEPRP